MHPVLSLLIGLIFAGVGGEMFVRGLVGIASWARIPAGVIGATVAAFATSSPELSVSVNAALAGTPQIALGDALGSNVVNIGLVLGLALLFGPIQDRGAMARREFPFALLAPALTFVLLYDGVLSRVDGALLLASFIAWLGLSVRHAFRERHAAEEVLGEKGHGKALVISLIGLGLLVLAGGFIVTGAKYVGESFGWTPFVVGATLVAIGTSIPELATTVISRSRGHDEVGLGTVLGSNLFNGLFIVSIAALIHPIEIRVQTVMIGLFFGLLTVALAMPNRASLVPKGRGLVLLGSYTVYIIMLVQGSPS